MTVSQFVILTHVKGDAHHKRTLIVNLNLRIPVTTLARVDVGVLLSAGKPLQNVKPMTATPVSAGSSAMRINRFVQAVTTLRTGMGTHSAYRMSSTVQGRSAWISTRLGERGSMYRRVANCRLVKMSFSAFSISLSTEGTKNPRNTLSSAVDAKFARMRGI